MTLNISTDVYGMEVARVPVGQLTEISKWTYWDGSNCVAGEANAVAAPGFPLITGVNPTDNGSGSWASAPVGLVRHVGGIYSVSEVSQ